MVLVNLHTLIPLQVEVVKRLDYRIELFLGMLGRLQPLQLLIDVRLKIAAAKRKLQGLLFEFLQHFTVVAVVDVLQSTDVVLKVVYEGSGQVLLDIAEEYAVVEGIILVVVDLFGLPHNDGTSRW